jgi:predicted transcriptional regulator
MIDLIKIVGSDHFLMIVEFVKSNPGYNASHLAKKLNIHIITVQRYLDTLEKYGFIVTDEKRGSGRPSKIYSYVGGSFNVNIDELLSEYMMRSEKIRETGNPDIVFSYDVDKEIVNAVLVGGKKGRKIKLDEKEGRFLWLVPPPDSAGEIIEKIARDVGIALPDAIKMVLELKELDVLEVIK